MEVIDSSLIDWSRAQFALTAMYHWIFVPLTLGLGVVMAVMETIYYRTRDVFWRETAKFWMKLFAINFAMGIATGLILEFQFGTNWSNYSWFVGDIFGAPLAIEGMVAFFMESTFVAVMYFGWNKVSKRAHLTATWMTSLGATLSALWILVANAWMQYPVGMHFNPETVRNEMADFWTVALSPVAIMKFSHAVSSCWLLGTIFVVGVSCWYLIKGRHERFALSSIKVAAIIGLLATAIVSYTGHKSASQVAQHQPMKLAAAEGYYHGEHGAGLVAVGMLRPNASWDNLDEGDSGFHWKVEIPSLLSILATHDPQAFIPGIKDILAGGYELPDGGKALSAQQMMQRGKLAIDALRDFRLAMEAADQPAMADARARLDSNFKYFGYGYLRSPSDLVPPVPLVFYAFRVMVIATAAFAFILLIFLMLGARVTRSRPLLWAGMATVPLVYLASQAGWVVSEVGRQPWAIQGILPNTAAVSKLDVSSVQITFFIFLTLFTLMLIAEICIMKKSIQKGPSV